MSTGAPAVGNFLSSALGLMVLLAHDPNFRINLPVVCLDAISSYE